MVHIRPLQLAASSTHESGAISPLDLLSAAVFATGSSLRSSLTPNSPPIGVTRTEKARCSTAVYGGTAATPTTGDALLWWGLWLNGLDEPLGALAIVCPLLMTYLLVKVSGVLR